MAPLTPPDAALLASLGALLDRAFELSVDERVVWLAELRQTQPAAAVEIAKLLGREQELSASGFLDRDASEGFFPEANARVPAGAPAPGRRVGAYVLARPIGQGGMGSVWLARRGDGRYDGDVAVKLLSAALLHPVGAERFRREGSALARLTHPNIGRLLDAGIADGGQPYLVLEYVNGLRIDQHCDQHRLTPIQRLELFQQVLAAVAHAHASLIVHRDIKPSNILVTPDGRATLLDFGIAKLLEGDAAAAERTDLTEAGGLPLTPEYAAPEQVTGGPITTATDVYALGVLLYLLLSGRHPTGAGRLSSAEHLRAVVDTEPPRLSAAVSAAGADGTAVAAARASTIERLGRLYLGDLDNIVTKALKKEPEERYVTVGAFADDLRRYLSHEPVSARPDSLRYRAGKFVRRNRPLVTLGVLAALALAGVVARERQLRGRAEAEARKAVAVEQYLVSVFGAADPFAPPESQPSEVTARALLDRGAARIDTTLADQPEVRAELRGALGRVYTNLGLYDRAAVQLRRSLAERRTLYGPAHPAVADAMDQLGLLLYKQDHLDEADTLFREALAQRRRLFANRHDATAETLDHLAALLESRDRFADAEPLAREALAIRQALHGDADLTVAASKWGLGRLLHSKGTFPEAAALFRDALAVRERQLGEDHPATAETMHDLARTSELQGRFAEAESLYRRALAVERRALGSAHPSVTRTLNALGQMLYHRTRRAEEAESLLREALALNRRMLGENHDAVSNNLGNLAVIVREQGDFEEAERLLRRALAIDRALYGPLHTTVAFDLNEIAAVLRMRGQPDSAVRILREALAQSRQLVGDDHRNTSAVKLHLGRALRESGQPAEAERVLRSALSKLDSSSPEAGLLMIPAQVVLGRTLTGMARAGEALPLLEPTVEMSRRQFGPADWRTAEAALALGECRLALGEFSRAEPLLRQADSLFGQRRRARPVLAAEAETAVRRLYKAWGRRGGVRTHD